MTKLQRITAKIEADKELQKGIAKLSWYDTERFIKDALKYISAIKNGRMINCIGNVSSSGMSRTIKFVSCEKYKYPGARFYYQNYFQLFKAFGYTEARSKDHYFSIGGCGMDMIFHTNYTNIHVLHRLGFISRKQCDHLAQQTPDTI